MSLGSAARSITTGRLKYRPPIAKVFLKLSVGSKDKSELCLRETSLVLIGYSAFAEEVESTRLLTLVNVIARTSTLNLVPFRISAISLYLITFH